MGSRIRTIRAVGCIMALVVTFAAPLVAGTTHAQDKAAAAPVDTAVASTYRFNIPAKSLLGALADFSEVTGIQLLYPADDSLKGQSQAVSGVFSAEQALREILKGSGITFRFINARAVTLEKASAAGAKLLGPVRVEGATQSGVAGVNGSTDPTATEGTHSYTSSALSIASKTPQSIQETPQSVSVITQQRLQDQNITDLTSLLNQATGVSVVTTTNPLAPTFYTRGFSIERLQVDGGAPMDMSNAPYSLVPQIDMAMYDHAELLRGADGLFNGYGDPGGVINLVRKRPLDHTQVVVEGQYGSWDNYRTTIDATAPLGFDGRLRGRAVMAYQNQDYFYDTANSNKTLAYGVVEGDLSPSTTVSVGADVTRQNATPFVYGLPRYQSGADLKLPRSTCLCFDWNHDDFDTKEYFARVDQALGQDWSFKVNLTRIQQIQSYKYGYVSGTVNPVSDSGPTMRAGMSYNPSKQTAADFTLNGNFELFGHRQQLVLGGNYSKDDGSGQRSFGALNTGRPAVDIFDFDPGQYLEPASNLLDGSSPQVGSTQWGAYTTLRLTLWDPLHFITGVRYSHYVYGYRSQSNCTDTVSYPEYGIICNKIGDVYATSQSQWSTHDLSWPPNYSLVYDVNRALSAYASYTDIYLEQSTAVDRSGNSIGPITGSNIEAGVKWSGRDGRVNATLSVYRLTQKNFSLLLDYGNYEATNGYLPDGIHQCCYSNDRDMTYLSQGADLEVTGELLPGWQMSTGYTYNKNEYEGAASYDSIGQPLVSQAPRHLLKLWSGYQFHQGGWLRRLNISGGVNAQSKSYTSGSACIAYDYGTDASGSETATCKENATVPFNFTQGFYAVFSARVAYQIDAHWNAALNVNNLTDRTYYQTAGTSTSGNWYGDPRNFVLTLRGSF